MEIMKIGPLVLADVSTRDSHVQNTRYLATEQYADTLQTEKSCCSSFFQMIADLFDSIVSWIKNFCGCSPIEKIDKPEVIYSQSKQLYFSKDGIDRFVLTKTNDREYGFPTIGICFEDLDEDTGLRPAINLQDPQDKKDFVETVIQVLSEDRSYQLLVCPNLHDLVDTIRGEKRFEFVEEFIHPRKCQMYVFRLR